MEGFDFQQLEVYINDLRWEGKSKFRLRNVPCFC